MDLTGPPRYIRLRVLETKKLDIGDIIKLRKEGESLTYLGQITAHGDGYVVINNVDAMFCFPEWDYDILHSEFDK